MTTQLQGYLGLGRCGCERKGVRAHFYINPS